jgi:hypothetical protein
MASGFRQIHRQRELEYHRSSILALGTILAFPRVVQFIVLPPAPLASAPRAPGVQVRCGGGVAVFPRSHILPIGRLPHLVRVIYTYGLPYAI